MDSHFLNGIGTVLAFIGFVSVCIWAYGSKRKQRFEEDAKLPFADEQPAEKTPDAGESDAGNRKNSGE